MFLEAPVAVDEAKKEETKAVEEVKKQEVKKEDPKQQLCFAPTVFENSEVQGLPFEQFAFAKVLPVRGKLNYL